MAYSGNLFKSCNISFLCIKSVQTSVYIYLIIKLVVNLLKVHCNLEAKQAHQLVASRFGQGFEYILIDLDSKINIPTYY